MYQGKVQDQELPGGYSARHLSMLTDEDAEEMHRAMMADETKVHGISVSNIYTKRLWEWRCLQRS